ncbi:MAG: non-canonical purine NTP pyrophosphatase [Deltaproteobacteria bacterium]|nr:non-canonical purine NTP pyrophosphatase [Deltaproteobacteria bacterium]
MRRLVVATQNRGKIREISTLLEGLGVEVLPIGRLAPGFDVDETGTTFLENARLKAQAAFAATGLPSLADDSGLCVTGLGLEPGVRSSRYAGEGKSDAERVEFLLSRMAGIGGDGRRAYFSCTLYAILPGELMAGSGEPSAPGTEGLRFESGPAGHAAVTVEGRLPGRIGFQPRGDKGFGYDPVFHPDHDPRRTLAEYGLDEKNLISHRGAAFRAFAAWLAQRLTRPRG